MFRKVFIILLIFSLVAACKAKTKEELFSEGVKMMQARNPNGAIVYLKNALEKDQNYFDARYELAKAYAAAHKHDQAEKEFEKVLRLNPGRDDVQLEFAKLYIQSNKPDNALEMVQRYLATHQESAEAEEILGRAYALKKMYKEAEQHLQQALKRAPERASAKLGLAEVYIGSRNEQDARTLLDDLISKGGNDSKPYYLLAGLEASLGRNDKAAELYRKISELNPQDSAAAYRSGMIFLDKGETDKAEKIADDLMKRFPKRPEGALLKGLTYYHRKNYTEAIILFQNSLKIQPAVTTYYFLGLSQYHKGELEQALGHFQKVAEGNPSFTQPRLLSALIHLNQKRPDEAIAEVNKVLAADDGNALAYNILGSAHVAKGLYDEAIKDFDTATDLDPKLIDAHLKKGIFEFGMGKTKEAETDLKAAVKVAPEVLNTRLILASFYMKQKDYPKAMAVLKEGVSGKKTDALLYEGVAVALFAQRKTEEGLSYLRKAKEANPDYFGPSFRIATYHAVRGEYEKASKEYGEVLNKDPKNVRALLGIASVFDLQNKDADALAYYRKAAETPHTAGAIALANYYIKKRDADSAVKAIDEALRKSPQAAELLEVKGKIYLGEKKYKEALSAFEQLDAKHPGKGLPLMITTYVATKDYSAALKKIGNRLDTDRDNLQLKAEVSRIYLLMDNPGKAADNAQGIIRSKPGSAYGYVVLASVYEHQKKRAEAITALKRGLEVDEKNVPARMMLGDLYTKNKDYALALSTYEAVAKKNPRYFPAVFAQGVIYDQTDRKKEAAKKYREVIEKSDTYVPALNNLAYLCLQGYGGKEEALEYAMRAIRQAPASAEVMDTLGYALLKNGRKDDAVKMLTRATALRPDNPSIHYHLALAYKEKGENAQAVESLKKATSLGSFPEANGAAQLLAQLNGAKPTSAK